jgi:hypothetical protein
MNVVLIPQDAANKAVHTRLMMAGLQNDGRSECVKMFLLKFVVIYQRLQYKYSEIFGSTRMTTDSCPLNMTPCVSA